MKFGEDILDLDTYPPSSSILWKIKNRHAWHYRNRRCGYRFAKKELSFLEMSPTIRDLYGAVEDDMETQTSNYSDMLGAIEYIRENYELFKEVSGYDI